MAHSLEGIKSGRVFTGQEMIHAHITFLLARMYDYKELNCNEEQKACVESWRDELHRIRWAADDLNKES